MIIKYIILITTFITTGCIVHTQGSCKYNNRYYTSQGSVCHEGDDMDKVTRKAIVQATSPAPTLIIQPVPGQRQALVLTEEDLDVLECTIRHYRDIYGYGPRCRQECVDIYCRQYKYICY
jgi:hypothetical protein